LIVPVPETTVAAGTADGNLNAVSWVSSALPYTRMTSRLSIVALYEMRKNLVKAPRGTYHVKISAVEYSTVVEPAA
jgi:hypothetical protein